MNRGIYVSIKPTPISKIVQGIKNYEFRNYIPKNDFRFLYVYVSKTEKKLKYIIEIGKILKYPDKIEVDGDGNKEFNNGSKFNYAYQILKVYELENPITLEVLKQRFDFVPPQAFTYDTRYPDLSDYLSKAKKHIVVENFTIK